MGMKDVFKRYLVFVIGLYFLAAGIVLIVRSALGTTPISSINYVLSLNSPLSLGTCTFLINMLLILGQFWIIRKNKTRQDTIEILLQLPFSFIFFIINPVTYVLATSVPVPVTNIPFPIAFSFFLAYFRQSIYLLATNCQPFLFNG